MKNKCKQCGNCCKGIRITGEPPEEVKHFWKEISEQEAIKLHPIFKLFKQPESKYYNCNLLINNKCSINHHKPEICRNYPSNDGHSIKDIDCGYFDKNDDLDFKIAFANYLMSLTK